MSNLTEIARNFIDNGGGTDSNGKKYTCVKARKTPHHQIIHKTLIAIDTIKNANTEPISTF